MKEHPILFSIPMVQAILQGRKIMTRREIKPQPIDNVEVDGNFFEGNHKGYVKVDGHPNWRDQFAHEFCRYKVGDLLWVRETFEVYLCNDGGEDYTQIRFVSDGRMIRFNTSLSPNKHPSIHMPKDAAQIWLEVRDVKVERLQEIGQEDAKAEGVYGVEWGESDHGGMPNYKLPFKNLWQSINGEESWSENRWVWVIQFKVLSTTGKHLAIVEETTEA
jgi:hypothetical protein